ncbi:MAG: RnfABCDGE type electron transport complex subunit D [Candidatus Omnitrophota bacterium]|nr:MAG: RnfABCDGE type electron transport complex subunit D [Candidatus Omnitrophota bacterium]
MKVKSVKVQLGFFLAAFWIYLVVRNKDLTLFFSTSIAVSSSVIIGCIFGYFKERKFSISSSVLITGLIIGLILSWDLAWWIYILASLVAISSKYIIRINKKHIFNPAAIGIFLVTIFLKAQTQWQGTYLWYLLIPFGFYFAYRVKKIEILLSYGVSALGLFAVSAAIRNVSLYDIFGYLSYFFIFIMLIEPKTTPLSRLGKGVFGVIVAVLIFVFTEAGAKFDVELGALLIANMAVPFINKLSVKKEVGYMSRLVLFFAIAFLGVTCFIVYAHPPAKITVTYDSVEKTIQAVILHRVSDPKTHYIKKVDVAVNGEEVIEHKISEQENSSSQKVIYRICDVKKADTISVEAYCSVSGKRIGKTKAE